MSKQAEAADHQAPWPNGRIRSFHKYQRKPPSFSFSTATWRSGCHFRSGRREIIAQSGVPVTAAAAALGRGFRYGGQRDGNPHRL